MSLTGNCILNYTNMWLPSNLFNDSTVIHSEVKSPPYTLKHSKNVIDRAMRWFGLLHARYVISELYAEHQKTPWQLRCVYSEQINDALMLKNNDAKKFNDMMRFWGESGVLDHNSCFLRKYSLFKLHTREGPSTSRLLWINYSRKTLFFIILVFSWWK